MKDVYFGIDMTAIGRRIDSLFTKYGITTRQMSDALHVTYQCVDKWRKGRALPETHNLFILSKLFDMDINEIISGEFNQKEIESKSLDDIISKINRVKKYNALCAGMAKSITLIDRVFFLNMQIDKEYSCYDNSFLSILYNEDFNGQELADAVLYITGLYIDIDNCIVYYPKDKRYAFYFKSALLQRYLLFVPKLNGL